MMSEARTEGEQLFEDYLLSQGLTDFEYEKCFPGKSKRPDYALRVEGKEYLFEVKDFACTCRPRLSVGTYSPHKRIREKVNRAERKFRQYKEWPCCLVLHNRGAPLVPLHLEWVVSGAMYGDLVLATDVDTERGEAVRGSERTVYGPRGKMLDPKTRRPQNTTISAILTLRRVPHSGQRERAVSMSVYENRFARIPLPRDLFCGPFDQRYALVGDQPTRVFVGCSLSKQDGQQLDGDVSGSS